MPTGDIFRNADLDHSSRVPPNQLGYVSLNQIEYPLKLLGEWSATDPLVGTGLIYHEGNLVTVSSVLYLCVARTTTGPPGADWRIWDQGNFALRADRVWDGGMPIFVGTAGLDGVDALLTPESPPFQNGWTNSLGPDPPVSFIRTVTGWIHISGGYVGGGNGTVVFTLPDHFRPEHRQRFVCASATTNHYATYYVEPNGDVVFGQVV